MRSKVGAQRTQKFQDHINDQVRNGINYGICHSCLCYWQLCSLDTGLRVFFLATSWFCYLLRFKQTSLGSLQIMRVKTHQCLKSFHHGALKAGSSMGSPHPRMNKKGISTKHVSNQPSWLCTYTKSSRVRHKIPLRAQVMSSSQAGMGGYYSSTPQLLCRTQIQELWGPHALPASQGFESYRQALPG